MMNFTAHIDIMPLKALLDPQGKAVLGSAKKTGFGCVTNIRIGKHVDIDLEAVDKHDAEEKIDSLCKKILSNPIIESYNFKIFEK